jgi:hypothetical protein
MCTRTHARTHRARAVVAVVAVVVVVVVEYEPATPRTPRTPNDVDPRPMATHRAVARDAKSHDTRRQMTARTVERRSIALKNRTHA